MSALYPGGKWSALADVEVEAGIRNEAYCPDQFTVDYFAQGKIYEILVDARSGKVNPASSEADERKSLDDKLKSDLKSGAIRMDPCVDGRPPALFSDNTFDRDT